MRQVLVYSRYQEHYEPVNPHLSISPRQIEQQTLQGRSVSTTSMENFVYFNGDMLDTLPMDMCRGHDTNDIWEAQQALRGKFTKLRHQRSQKLHDEQVAKQKGADNVGV